MAFGTISLNYFYTSNLFISRGGTLSNMWNNISRRQSYRVIFLTWFWLNNKLQKYYLLKSKIGYIV